MPVGEDSPRCSFCGLLESKQEELFGGPRNLCICKHCVLAFSALIPEGDASTTSTHVVEEERLDDPEPRSAGRITIEMMRWLSSCTKVLVRMHELRQRLKDLSRDPISRDLLTEQSSVLRHTLEAISRESSGICADVFQEIGTDRKSSNDVNEP